MNTKEDLISAALTQMSTMRGWPPLTMPRTDDEEMEPVALSYALPLSRMPESTLRVILGGVTLRYNDRPDVKQLGEWAAAIAQAKTSAPDYLSLSSANTQSAIGADHLLGGHGPDSIRQAYPERPGSAGLAALTDAASAAELRETRRQGGTIPQAMKDAIGWLREREQIKPAPTACREDAGEWGLEYISANGTSEKHPARYAEAVARAKANEVRRQYSHLTVRVWCKNSVSKGAAGTGMLAGGAK